MELNKMRNMTEVELTADGLKTDVANVKGDISEVKQTADTVTAVVMNEEHGLAKVELTANGVKSEVADLTKDGGRISQIEQAAGSITLKVGEIEDWKNNDAATKDFVKIGNGFKNLNIDIEPGEKIGVVGRTGSGKSTLCLSLYRILEAETGKILIDNIKCFVWGTYFYFCNSFKHLFSIKFSS